MPKTITYMSPAATYRDQPDNAGVIIYATQDGWANLIGDLRDVVNGNITAIPGDAASAAYVQIIVGPHPA